MFVSLKPPVCRACLAYQTNCLFVRFNHYKVLGVKKNATQKEIRHAYLELSKKEHPDQNRSSKASHDRFVKITKAYEVLGKEDSRREYDLTMSPAFGSVSSGGYPRPPNTGPSYQQRPQYGPQYGGQYGSQYGQQRSNPNDPFNEYGNPYSDDPFSDRYYDYFRNKQYNFKEWQEFHNQGRPFSNSKDDPVHWFFAQLPKDLQNVQLRWIKFCYRAFQSCVLFFILLGAFQSYRDY